MRSWWLALLLVPWAGCLGGPGTAASLHTGLFEFDPVDRKSDPVPAPVSSCQELLGELNRRALDESRILLEQSVQGQYHGGMWLSFNEGSRTVALAATAAEDSAGGSAAPQVTGTNNQEAAADEADLVKTDGEWTYVLAGNVLHILRMRSVGDISPHARLDLGETYGGQLLLERGDPADRTDDRLVLVLQQGGPDPVATRVRVWPFQPPLRSRRRVAVVSLEDRLRPTVVREEWVEGHLAGARLVDGVAHIVVHTPPADLGLQTWAEPNGVERALHASNDGRFASMPMYGESVAERRAREAAALRIDRENRERLEEVDVADHLPLRLSGPSGITVPEAPSESACRRVQVTPQQTGRGLTTILSIGVADRDLPVKTVQAAGGTPIVYASGDALVLASPSQDLYWYYVQPDLLEATDLQWFTLDGLDVTLRAAGRVPGTILDSFALDIEGDALRVATTTGTWGRWWDEAPEPMLSQVLVLDEVAGALVPRGATPGLAPGERIWSVRFTEDRAYVVTFRQTDPLWVIDLASPVPTVLGELHIPGVSTYIHPLGDRLLTIGYPGGPDGLGLDWSRVQLQVFDVSDPTDPVQADVLDLPGGGSVAVDEHKAFTYWDAAGVLAVPFSSWQDGTWRSDGTQASPSRMEAGLTLVDVDVANGSLSLRGDARHDSVLPAETWAGVERSYFLGDPAGAASVYSVSMFGVTSHDLGTLRLQDAHGFHG